MTNYKGTQVLYTNEYGESIKTIADVDSDGTVYFEPNEHGLVIIAKLESLIAHGQLLEADWERNADKLHDAIEQARQADEIADDAGWLGTHETKLPPAKMTTLQQLADAKERSFNRRYYNNPDGLPEFKY